MSDSPALSEIASLEAKMMARFDRMEAHLAIISAALKRLEDDQERDQRSEPGT